MSNPAPVEPALPSAGGGWSAVGAAVVQRVEGMPRALLEARGHLFPFAPVFLGLGVGVYFSLRVEPAPWMIWVLGLGALGSVLAGLRGPELARAPAFAVALVLAGLGLAFVRAHAAAAPVLTYPRYGPIEGRIVMVDRSASDALRLTLDQLVLPGLAPSRTPHRVRVSLADGTALDVDPVVGTRVGLTGFLGPPGAPVEPGGFDFRRLAWFEGLGAVGYARSPVLAIASGAVAGAEGAVALALGRLRQSLSLAIRARLPGQSGGFVAALLTGDRSGVDLATTEALRRSNLAHLLAISGLHMGLLTGFVYMALRMALALIPRLALRWPIRKIAAVGALMAAAVYLALSGGNVATQRAFVMAAVMLGAVLVGRRVVSLRSVALAALLVLAWRPESLMSAGFQMSFAATVALVAVFQALRVRRRGKPRQRPTLRSKLLDAVVSTVLCSLIAGLATAPIAAAQFHRMAEYGLLANLLSVPLMGILVMPAAVLAAVLWPLGLAGVGLALMDLGARWILSVAHAVGGIEDAVRLVPVPPDWVIPVAALAALGLALWPGRARWAGGVVLVLALAGWGTGERPALLVDAEGALVGLWTEDGRILSRARGAGYEARGWLEADGDAATQAQAAARPGFAPIDGGVEFTHAGQIWRHLWGRAGLTALAGACRDGATVVIDARLDATPAADCRVLDRRALGRTGALAIAPDGETRSVREVSGARPWTGFHASAPPR